MTVNSGTVLRLLTALAICLTGCEMDYSVSNNSSKGDNDYFEETISERSAKYSRALDTSNKFVEHFSSGDLEAVIALMDPRLREKAPLDTLQNMREVVLTNFGPLVEFKPMQWSFATHTNVENVVICTKIVIHAKSETFYVLKFEDNGKYDRIMGFNIWSRENDAPVSQAVARFFESK